MNQVKRNASIGMSMLDCPFRMIKVLFSPGFLRAKWHVREISFLKDKKTNYFISKLQSFAIRSTSVFFLKA